MTYQATHLDVSLVRQITPPQFEIGRDAIRVISAIYEEVTKQFAFSLADIQGLPGSSVADVGIRGAMFGGKLRFEFTPDKIQINARDLRTWTDVQVISACAILLQAGLHKAMPGASFGISTLTINGWLGKTPNTNPPPALAALSTFEPVRKFEQLPGESIRYAGRLEVKNEAEGYSCDLALDQSLVAGAELYFRVAIEVQPSSKHFEVDALGALANELSRRWLAYSGVPLINSVGQ